MTWTKQPLWNFQIGLAGAFQVAVHPQILGSRIKDHRWQLPWLLTSLSLFRACMATSYPQLRLSHVLFCLKDLAVRHRMLWNVCLILLSLATMKALNGDLI